MRLRQVLINLVGNSIKFTEKGYVEVRIEPGHQANEVTCWVRDTGIGIPREKQEAIFSAFVQADGSITRKYGGAGLGLAISARLVKLMNGSIRLESEPGRGTTFEVTLPYQLQAEVSTALAASPLAADGSSRPLQILLAEDNPVNQLLAVRMLQKQGHSIQVCADGLEALEALREQSFDLILMDVNMPRMNGLETTASIRAGEARSGRRIPIIAMTACAMTGDKELCVAAGMDAYITKPVVFDELFKAIADATRVKIAIPAG